MRILGLSAGNAGGSAEILLELALRAAEQEGADTALVCLDELELPLVPLAPGQGERQDDGLWLWDQVMESDGLIIASPIYSRTIPGTLKLVADRLAGPAADVVFAEAYRAMLARGEAPPVAFPYDERVLRPRVAGLIAVGGALSSNWQALALPVMHQMTFSAQIAVADQMLATGAGMPRSVVLDEAALASAARVGSSVGSQLGRTFDEVEYRGDPGLCPLCHLSAITLSGTEVECATCGAGGRIEVEGGAPHVRFHDLDRSVITLAQKRAHFAEVQATAAAQGAHAEEIARRASELLAGSGRRLSPQALA